MIKFYSKKNFKFSRNCMFDESACYYKNVVFSLNQLVIELPQRAVS